MDGETTLLTYLRESLGLYGAKNGCGQGQCGTCTVLVNGRPTKSCAVKLKSKKLINASIETIEGLTERDGTLHPIQEAFINAGSIQCGFCTPGMIMTVKGLLHSNPKPDRQEIRKYISSRNYCRCTGYQKIFLAVEEAARLLRGEAPQFDGYPDDAPLRKTDAVLKARGIVRYADDIVPDGLLHGKILFSDEPHAILKRLDTSAAESMPGVAGVITAGDFGGTGKIGLVHRDQPALVAEGAEIRSMADPICAVFAESADQAAAALKAVIVEYQVLPGVFTIGEAENPDAVLVWPEKPGNIFYEGCLQRGDALKELESSKTVVEGRFSTSRIIHGYMEPESGLARPDGDGGVEIHYPTQTVFDDQIQIAEVLGVPREKIRVVQLPTGGAFGGKEDLIFQPIIAAAALRFNRAVKITLTRAESLQVAQKKHPAEFDVKLGLDSKGRFKVLKADIVTDKGAYATLGFDIIENMMAFIGGSYYIPTILVNGKSMHTHNVMSGAMRGFGANQSNFVIESLVDMAASKTGLNPIDIRLINALKPGLPTITNHVLEPGIPGVIEVLEATRTAVKTESVPKAPEGTVLGFGVACGVKNVGFGHSLPESAGARVVLSSNGDCRLFVTHHEYGQGAVIGQARIASELLGIPIDRIIVNGPDTKLTPYTGATTASRQTFLSGNATVGACGNLLSDLLSRASEKMGILDPASLAIEGTMIVEKGGEGRIPLSELGEEFQAEFRAMAPDTEGFPEGDKNQFGSPEFKNRRTHWAYAYGAQAAWVAVDKISGKVSVLKIITVCDVGRVLNRRAVEGQQEGGVMMGVGYALSEEFLVEKGRNLTRDLRGSGIPKAGDAPEIINIIVEVPHPQGPLGAKGFAEAPSLATAPAVANAIYDAIGVRMYHLPITPKRVKAAMERAL